MKYLSVRNIVIASACLIAGALVYIVLPGFYGVSYVAVVPGAKAEPLSAEPEKKPRPPAAHIATPEAVKSIYMTSWVAGTPSIRNKLIKLMDDTEINSVVIDIKDYTGRISFEVSDPYLIGIGSSENRIADIHDLINILHEKNIYIIGRVAVFQDQYLIKKFPELAVKRLSDKSAIWRDYKGIGWLDAGEIEVWKYAVAISEEAYKIGFDEINFDYIRFPSDGNMKDIYYPKSDGQPKPDVMRNFFKYTNENLKPRGIVLSADLFGMTATNTDDLNIGQVLEYAIPYFDFVAPMVYPSHYPPGWNGHKNPAAVPYEVVNYSMTKAAERVKAMNENPLKLRPWLQDFNLGATYTKEMVQAQIKAVYDAGLTSWMIWDASNTYTEGAVAAI